MAWFGEAWFGEVWYCFCEAIELGARETEPIKMMEMAKLALPLPQHKLRNPDFLDNGLVAPGERNYFSHKERYRYDHVYAIQCMDNH